NTTAPGKYAVQGTFWDGRYIETQIQTAPNATPIARVAANPTGSAECARTHPAPAVAARRTTAAASTNPTAFGRFRSGGGLIRQAAAWTRCSARRRPY